MNFTGKILASLFGLVLLAACLASPLHASACGFGPAQTKLISQPFPDPSIFSDNGTHYATSTSSDATRLVIEQLSLSDSACGPAERVIKSHTLRLTYEKLALVDPNFFPKRGSVSLNNYRTWGIWSPSIQRNRSGQLRLYATIHFGYFNTAVAVFHPAAGQSWSRRTPVRHWVFQKFVAGGGAGGLKTFSAYDFKTELHAGKRYAIFNYNPYKGSRGSRQSIFIQEIDDQDRLKSKKRATYEFRADPKSEIAWGTLPLVEGGSVLAHKGKFYLFYTTGTFLYPDYRIGIAVSSKSILGPYHKMMASGDIAYVLQSRNPKRPGYTKGFFNAPGIPTVIAGAKGNLKMVFHANDGDERPSRSSCGAGINGTCFNARKRYTHVLDFDIGTVVFDHGKIRPRGASIELPAKRE